MNAQLSTLYVGKAVKLTPNDVLIPFKWYYLLMAWKLFLCHATMSDVLAASWPRIKDIAIGILLESEGTGLGMCQECCPLESK